MKRLSDKLVVYTTLEISAIIFLQNVLFNFSKETPQNKERLKRYIQEVMKFEIDESIKEMGQEILDKLD